MGLCISYINTLRLPLIDSINRNSGCLGLDFGTFLLDTIFFIVFAYIVI